MFNRVKYLKNILLLLLVAVIVSGCEKVQPITLKEGEAFPIAALYELQAATNTKKTDYKNKTLVINFWATWCPPCRQEIPHFIELFDELQDRGLEIVGVSVDTKGVETVRSWTAKKRSTIRS